MTGWHGTQIQEALLNATVVEEARITDAGPGEFYYLKLGSKIVPLGIDRQFAAMLVFALRRNAEAFENSPKPKETTA